MQQPLNGDKDIYNTAFFLNPKKKLMELSGKQYTDDLKSFRIIFACENGYFSN